MPHHSGFMRLNLKMSSACLALLDDRSDHYLENLAVTLQVSLISRVSRQFFQPTLLSECQLTI